MTKRIDLRLPDVLHSRLQAIAVREQRSIHELILMLLDQGVHYAELREKDKRFEHQSPNS
jgi:hypothetical protein